MQSLTKKQRSTNADWIKALENIEQLVSKSELDKATRAVVADIRKTTKGKKSAYAWSGGKDSVVLGHICEQAGIKDCMIGICNLEYPAFFAWINENKPSECEVINTGQDMEWLKKHPEMLFPKDSSTSSRWFSIIQHAAQRKYVKNRNIDILILGRRRADGNYVGGADLIYTDGKGVTRFSPLADWKHEYILAYIHYYKLPLPPIYEWHNGFVCGTHPWPARQWTNGNGWREIYDIDPTIVKEAAAHIDGAREFMEGVV